MIEFFLSSDDDSIAHGTIWPQEVKAALDRMEMMLIFVSADALKKGWTYFEAGYGLHKLGRANNYCLPGTDKAALKPPFDLVQNRNLHSARELALLVDQCNVTFGGKLDATVSKADFDQIFRRPILAEVESGPNLHDVVSAIRWTAIGPSNSLELFEQACKAVGMPTGILPDSSRDQQSWRTRCSTGIQLAVQERPLRELACEIKITDKMRQEGGAIAEEVIKARDFDDIRLLLDDSEQWIPISEIERRAKEVINENAEIERENIERVAAARACSFDVSPINIATPLSILDRWLALAKPFEIEPTFLILSPEVTVETRPEIVSSKIEGSALALHRGGTLIWRDFA